MTGKRSDGATSVGVCVPSSGEETVRQTGSRLSSEEPRVARGADTDLTDSVEDPTSSALQERVGELELRLRERMEENSLLDEEVRCLLAERKIRDEYIASMEGAVLRLPIAERQLLDTDNAYKELDGRFSSYRTEADGRMAELTRQIDSYRARRVVKAADRLAARIRQFPLAARFARSLRRTLANRPTRH